MPTLGLYLTSTSSVQSLQVWETVENYKRRKNLKSFKKLDANTVYSLSKFERPSEPGENYKRRHKREKIDPKMLAGDVYQGGDCHFQMAGCESSSKYMFCD